MAGKSDHFLPRGYTIGSNTNFAKNERNSDKIRIEKLQFPQTRCALWDHRPKGEPVILHVTHYRNPIVVLEEKTIRLAHHYAQASQQQIYSCGLIGSVTSEADGEGLRITIDRFNPESHESPSGHSDVPGDIFIPFMVKQKTSPRDILSHGEKEYSDCIKVLHHCCSSKARIDLCNFIATRATCMYTQNKDYNMFNIELDMVAPSVKFQATPINAVPIVPTALSKNLSGPLNISEVQGEPKTGYLTMDHTRKLLLVIESDPKVNTLPLVGIWISGSSNVYDPFVWASCLRYMFNSVISERVCYPPEPFLIVLYSPLHSKPEFYQCTTTNGKMDLDFDLSTCNEIIQLHKSMPDRAQSPLELDITAVESGSKNEHFHAALENNRDLLTSAAKQCKHSPSNVSGSLEEIMPRSLPAPQHFKVSSTGPTVPEVSLIFDDRDGIIPSPHPSEKCDNPPAASQPNTFNPYLDHVKGHKKTQKNTEEATLTPQRGPLKPVNRSQPMTAQKVTYPVNFTAAPSQEVHKPNVHQPPMRQVLDENTGNYYYVPINSDPTTYPNTSVPSQFPCPGTQIPQGSGIQRYGQHPEQMGQTQLRPMYQQLQQYHQLPSHTGSQQLPYPNVNQYQGPMQGQMNFHQPQVRPLQRQVLAPSSRPYTSVQSHVYASNANYNSPKFSAANSDLTPHMATTVPPQNQYPIPENHPQERMIRHMDPTTFRTRQSIDSQRQALPFGQEQYAAGSQPLPPSSQQHILRTSQANPQENRGTLSTQQHNQNFNRIPQHNILQPPNTSNSVTQMQSNVDTHSGATNSTLQSSNNAQNFPLPGNLPDPNSVPPQVYALLKYQDEQLKVMKEQLEKLLANQTGPQPTPSVATGSNLVSSATQSSQPSSPNKKHPMERRDTCSIAINTSFMYPPASQSNDVPQMNQSLQNTHHDEFESVGASHLEQTNVEDQNGSGSTGYVSDQTSPDRGDKTTSPKRLVHHQGCSPVKAERERSDGNFGSETLTSFGELHLTQHLQNRPEDESIMSEMMVDMPAYTSLSPEKCSRQSNGSSGFNDTNDSERSPMLGESVSMYQQNSLMEENEDTGIGEETDMLFKDQKLFYENLIGNVKKFLNTKSDEMELHETQADSVLSQNTTVPQMKGELPKPQFQSHASTDTSTATSVDIEAQTREQLRKMGIDLDKMQTEQSFRGNNSTFFMDPSIIPKINYVSMMLDRDTDVSADADSLAMKYLSDEQLSELAKLRMNSPGGKAAGSRALNHVLSVGHRSEISVCERSANQMSFASKKYMERYGLLGDITTTGELSGEEAVEGGQPQAAILNVKEFLNKLANSSMHYTPQKTERPSRENAPKGGVSSRRQWDSSQDSSCSWSHSSHSLEQRPSNYHSDTESYRIFEKTTATPAKIAAGHKNSIHSDTTPHQTQKHKGYQRGQQASSDHVPIQIFDKTLRKLTKEPLSKLPRQGETVRREQNTENVLDIERLRELPKLL